MNILRKPFKYTNAGAVYWLIGINILVFAVSQYFGRGPAVFLKVAFPMIPIAVMHGWVWTFVTYMFMHGSISHLLLNMLGLFVFGVAVERQIGSREFLLYYFLTGILAGVFSFGVYILTGAYIVALMGASGAIFAVELAYAVLFPNSVLYLWGILPLKAPVMVLGFTALEIIFTITGANSSVAHFTHLAGFGIGWLYFPVRYGVNPWRRLTGRY